MPEGSSLLLDLRDVLGHARTVGAAVEAAVPPSMVRRIVLNEAEPGAVDMTAGELSAKLRRLHNALKGELVGGQVNYAALKGSQTYTELKEAARWLHGVRPSDFESDDERIAFWMNLYNVLVIHGIIHLEIAASIMEVPSFFAKVAYRVGEQSFTSDDIEHGVLRRNAKHLVFPIRLFGRTDPRLAFLPSRRDPRVHMGLVCGANSCPAVAFYAAESLNQQLDAASRGFVDSEVLVEDHQVLLPAQFKYFAEDFGGSDGVREFLLRHATGEQRKALKDAFEHNRPHAYRRYDWGLNHA